MELPFSESLIIIPTYNEIDNIEIMIDTIFGLYPEVNVLIVEDGSPDGTANIVKKKKLSQSKLHIIERSGKLSLGSAYVTGFQFAIDRGFNYVFEMDCDFSHNPQDIKYLLEAALDWDLVIGSRYIKGAKVVNWPIKRLLLSKLAAVYSRFITGIPLRDATGGFKCFTRKALESINLESIISNGYIFQFELNYLMWKNGMKIKEIPITFHERKHGKSKMEKGIIIEALFNVLIIRFKVLWDESGKIS